MTKNRKNKGWRHEPIRHMLSSKGVETVFKKPDKKISTRSMGQYLSDIDINTDNFSEDIYDKFVQEEDVHSLEEWYDLDKYKDDFLIGGFVQQRLAEVSDKLIIQYLNVKGIRRWQIEHEDDGDVDLIDNYKKGQYIASLRIHQWNEVDFEFVEWVAENKNKYKNNKKKFTEDVEKWFKDKTKLIVKESIEKIKEA